MPGTLFVVATPIGNLEDITSRALRVLRKVPLIAAEDTRRTAKLLSHYKIATSMTSLHRYSESRKVGAILARLHQGDDVALVSDAGTPTISDPGQLVIRRAIQAGIRVEPIPGPSAILAALVSSGFDTQAFTFLGFPPTRSKDRKVWLDQLTSAEHTAVFFEAPHRILRTLEEIRQEIGDCQISVGRELTKIHEEFFRGPISAVLSQLQPPRGEYTVIVEIGRKTNHQVSQIPTRNDIRSEFGHMVEQLAFRRRDAIRELARRYGVSSRDVYRLLYTD
jgi:16S rRNA (cytidine1402-2'-O)-methyltransferase